MDTLEDFFAKKRKGYKKYKEGHKFKTIKKASGNVKKGYKGLSNKRSMLDIFR